MLWRVLFVPTLHKGTTRSLLSVLENVGLLWITCLLWVCLLVSVCFGLHECVLLKKWAETRQAHYSAFCVAPGNWLMLLFTMYLHFFKIGRKINLFSWDSFNFERFFISINDFSCFYMSLWLVLQESNPCFNRNLIFFLFDFCLYTSLWYKRGKSNLFSIIVMQINAPSTPQIPSEGWFCSHQWHP